MRRKKGAPLRTFLGSHTNIRQDWKGLPETNILPYLPLASLYNLGKCFKVSDVVILSVETERYSIQNIPGLTHKH